MGIYHLKILKSILQQENNPSKYTPINHSFNPKVLSSPEDSKGGEPDLPALGTDDLQPLKPEEVPQCLTCGGNRQGKPGTAGSPRSRGGFAPRSWGG